MRHVKASHRATVEFGRRVRERRLALRLTQQTVADAVGIDRAVVSGLEHGTKNPSFGSLLGLARVLRVDAGTLVRGLHRL